MGPAWRRRRQYRPPFVEALLDRARIAREKRQRAFGQIDVPDLPTPSGEEQSTQAAFGRVLLEIAKQCGTLADRIVTTSPDVTVSTNLGAWVNQRGLFRRNEMPDVFAKAKIASAQKWSGANKGQHIELGIAENNLFLMLAAAGLAGDQFGVRLAPIGTLYDPFIARLDALNYACYQTRASCSSPRRAASRLGRRAAPTSRSTRHSSRSASRACVITSQPSRTSLRR